MTLSLVLGLLTLSLPPIPVGPLVLDEDVRGVVAGASASAGHDLTDEAYAGFGAPFDDVAMVFSDDPHAWSLAQADQASSFDEVVTFTVFTADAFVLASGGGTPGARYGAIAVSQVDVGFVTTLPRAFTLNVTITGEGDGRAALVRLTGTDGFAVDIDWTHIECDGVFVVDGVLPPAFNVSLFACLEATTNDTEVPGESSAAMALSLSTRLAADIDGDGDIDGDDLGQLLAEWGACPGCPSDLDGDDTVGGGDIGWFLASWATSA